MSETITAPGLDWLFHPRSVAVVGVSPDLTKVNFGREFLLSLVNTGYQGRLYPVGLEAGEVYGLPVYRSLKDVLDIVDYVIVAIPARATLELMRDAAAKGVRAIHFFTAGFREIGDESEKHLEQELIALAREKGIRVLGPNCMGIYYPKCGLAFHADFTSQSGTLGFIAQSGGNSAYAVRLGTRRGIFFSKVISYGNAADLNETDFLEYLTADAETGVIAMYIEGVRDGRRFFAALKRAAQTKPVMVYKGGNTEIGKNAALSHTGSIAGSGIIWHNAIKQAGAIPVSDIDEIIDLALLFKFAAPPRAKDTAIIGLGGGASVLVADAWSEAGLTAPRFPSEIHQQLKAFFGSEAGSSLKNPLDMFPMFSREVVQHVIEVVASWKQIDRILIHLPLSFINNMGARVLQTNTEAIASLPEEIRKRLMVVLHVVISPEDIQAALAIEKAFWQAGLPTYPSARRAANALSKFVRYYEKKL